MLEAFREMLDMVKHAPEYTMWVLLGILFYKVFIAGSWIMIARLFIVKLHDYFKSPPDKIHKWELEGQVLGKESVTALAIVLARLERRKNEIEPPTSQDVYINHWLGSSRYIGASDIGYLSDALNSKILADKAAKAAKAKTT